jgi:hypothetical protein
MLTNTERQIIEDVVERLRNDPSLVPEAYNHLEALRAWLASFVIAPLEMVADETRIYDRYDRLMQLESARSLSKMGRNDLESSDGSVGGGRRTMRELRKNGVVATKGRELVVLDREDLQTASSSTRRTCISERRGLSRHRL